QEQVRSYPQATLAAHVVGFTNQDGNGQYGAEEHYNSLLEGKEGIKTGAKNPASYLLAAFAVASQDGQNIILTMDYNIQQVAESLLEKAKVNLGIEGGTIIVMDPSSGKILALANNPTFDPNSYSKVTDIGVFQNPAIQKIFEPGSVFKALTMASALDQEAVTPQTTYQDEGSAQIGGRKITNYDQRVWGKRTMTEVLEYSINTGAVFAERKLGHQKFLEYLEKFGIFKPTNIDLAGEIFSQNAEFKKGYEINFATASFGQGIEMTPLQLLKAFSAIANNGVLAHPFIVEGNQSEKKQAQVISKRTASQITQMLTSVVQSGFAKTAQIPVYDVAGKTVSAQISWSALGVAKSGYSDKTIQSFVGYAPAFDPEFLILVKLDNPATKTAEYSAVPIFRDLAKYIIDYYQIPPDYEVE
ncbi:MAG: penicillin-binding protein 2, partial [Patescibacteria group bacterium]